MSQQLKFADGTTLPITLSQGESSTYPYQGGNRDCIDFQITGDAITFDVLDTLTANAANTGKLVLITDGTDSEGTPFHTEGELDNYTLRVEFGKTTMRTSPGNSTTPPTYEERMHVVLAQKTYDEYMREQQQAQIDALVLATLEA